MFGLSLAPRLRQSFPWGAPSPRLNLQQSRAMRFLPKMGLLLGAAFGWLLPLVWPALSQKCVWSGLSLPVLPSLSHRCQPLSEDSPPPTLTPFTLPRRFPQHVLHISSHFGISSSHNSNSHSTWCTMGVQKCQWGWIYCGFLTNRYGLQPSISWWWEFYS